MTYGLNRMLRVKRHDASINRPAIHDQEATVMDPHRSRRTRDQAGKTWYAYYRQVRFARWFSVIVSDANSDQGLFNSPSTARPDLTESRQFSEPQMNASC